MALVGFLLSSVFPLVSVTATKPALSHGVVDDISFSNFIPHKGQRLSGTPLKYVKVISFIDCLAECSINTRCLSANVNTSNAQGLLDCELLDIEKYQPENNLTSVEGIDHYALPVPCNCSKASTCLKSESGLFCKTCPPGYKGANCQSNYRDCSEIRAAGITNDGVYTIDPDGRGKFPVLCDMTTDGGGWTVFHKRFDFSVNFNRNWEAYKNGFGNLSHGEFWLGNEKTHRLTAAKASTLRVDLEDTNGLKKFAKYSTFKISDENDFYRLSVGGYSGTAGDSLDYKAHKSWASNGMRFSTPDKDNDLLSSGQCSSTSGFWFNWCGVTRMNTPDKIIWMDTIRKKGSMKLRPKDP